MTQIATFWNLLDQTITFPDTCILEALVRKERISLGWNSNRAPRGVKWQQPGPESVLGGMEFTQNEGEGKKPFILKSIFPTVQPHNCDLKKEYVNIGSVVKNVIYERKTGMLTAS